MARDEARDDGVLAAYIRAHSLPDGIEGTGADRGKGLSEKIAAVSSPCFATLRCGTAWTVFLHL